MTILHVYAASDVMSASYVQMLTHALEQKVRMLQATTQADVDMLWKLERPDVVHLHGAPGLNLPVHCRLVVTPHGQRPDLHRQPYVVVARSTMESKQIAPLCQRIAIVLNPIITKTTTPATCAAEMLCIYRRILYSNVLQLMSSTTRQACCSLLLLDITSDVRWLPPHAIDDISQADMAHLAIYATHEGIMPMVSHALALLDMPAPEVPPYQSYLPDGFCEPKPMQHADIPQLLADISRHGPSMLRLAEVARALHSNTLDEDALRAQIEDCQATQLFEAILQLLVDFQLISEGFIPSSFHLRDDRALRQALILRQSPVGF